MSDTVEVQTEEGVELTAPSQPGPGERLVLRECTVRDLDWREVRVEGEVVAEGCRFVGAASFQGTEFAEKVSFKGSVFEDVVRFDRARFEGDANFDFVRLVAPSSFDGCEVLGEASFREALFQHKCSFEEARFERFASFRQATFHQESTFDGAFFREVAQFHNVRIYGRFSAVAATFNARALETSGEAQDDWTRYSVFSNSRFHDVADFTEAVFGAPVRFVLCVFEQEVRFNGATFRGYSSFDRARFDAVVNFLGAGFHDNATLHLKDARLARIEIDLRQLERVLHCLNPEQYETHLRRRAELLREALDQGRVYPGDQRHLEKIDAALRDIRRTRLEEGSRTLAVLHKAFNDSFNARGEDWAYVTLRRMERQALGAGQRYRRFLSWLLDQTCGYGTNPWKVAASALIVVLLFCLIYLVLPGSFEGDMSFREALTFSFRTFTSSELDSQISPKGAIQWLVMFQSVLGYVVMMLLVITLSRLVIRS